MGEVIALETVKRTDGSPARVQVYAAVARGDRPRRAGARAAAFGERARRPSSASAGRRSARRSARLRDERLVEIVPQLGTFVSRISPQAVGDAQFIREALECAAVRRAAELAGEDDIASSRRTCSARTAPRRRRPRYLLPARRRLPSRRCATSAATSPSGRSASAPRRTSTESAGSASALPDYLREMIDEHRAVVAAVAAHDPDPPRRAAPPPAHGPARGAAAARASIPEFFEDG